MSNARARNAAAQRKYNPNPRPAAGLADFIKAGIQAQVNLNRKDAGLRPVKSAPRPIGNLPPSARVLSQYPPGVPTGVGGGNAAQSTDAPTFATTSPDIILETRTDGSPSPFAGGQGAFTGGQRAFAGAASGVSSGQIDQFQQAAAAAKAYQDQVDNLKGRVGGEEGFNLIGEMSTAPNVAFAAPGMTAPVDLSLSDYYTAQNVVGQGRFNQQNEEIDTVMNQLGYDEKMREWALANPMLAQREYARMNARQAGMEPVLINPDDEYTPAAEGSWIEYAVN
jgi:hypothetical protein